MSERHLKLNHASPKQYHQASSLNPHLQVF